MTESSKKEPGGARVCPASGAAFLATRIRKLIHNPEKIMSGLIEEGQTALDVGCGPGFFTLAMAKMVGDSGIVIAADLQQKMLDILRRRAGKDGLEPRIRFLKTEPDKIGLQDMIDFALVFYMLHEVPNPQALLQEIYDHLNSNGKLLLVEPIGHVSGPVFARTIEIAETIGFSIINKPKIIISRVAVLKRA